jgi:hypothetical protein
MEPHAALPVPQSFSVNPEPIGTFARAIIIEAAGSPRRRAVDCASAILHAGLIAVLTVVPLFLSGGPLPSHSFTEADMIVTVPPALAPRKSLAASQLLAFSRITIPIPVLSPPVFHTGERLTPPPYVAAPPSANFEGVTGGIDSLPAPGLADSRVLVDPGYSPDSQASRVGGDLQLAHAIAPLLLPYPEAARRFRITGRVILHALVDEQGKVRYVRALSGPALLVDAAVRAISKEIFAPAILDGKATTCDLLVVVNFSLF